MPWLSIIIALLSFFLSKASGASTEKSMVVAGMAGLGTHAVTHNTDWGKANLGELDGADVQPVLNADGSPKLEPSTGEQIVKTTGDVLKSWGGAGTAAVIGTTAMTTGSGGALGSTLKNNLPLILLAVGAFLILK